MFTFSFDMEVIPIDMDLDTAKKTVNFIFQTPADNITIEFQGGEPTLNFETIKYINEYAKELNKSYGKGIEFLLVTNLNNMDDDKMKAKTATTERRRKAR